MNGQLQLDPTGGELLTSVWKDLDAKFLSNDTQTNAQKMLLPVSPLDRLDHILNHPSLYIRASDLILYLENVGIFHLRQHFQVMIDAIFGYTGKYPGWSLRSITKVGNPREASVILRLLGPTGPLVCLATRLLEDPGFMIEVGLDRLPLILSQKILQGNIPPYFTTRLCPVDPYAQAGAFGSFPMIRCVRLNTFEFFFLSFTAHICALRGGNPSDYLVGWGSMSDNLYNNLLEEYLVYFFPCTGHGVPCDNFRLSYQQVNDSMYIAQTLRTQMMHAENSGMGGESSSPRLIKPSLLMEQAQIPSIRGDPFFRKSQAQKEVWRTEAILLMCTEIWMATPGQAHSDNFGNAMLPTVDVVKAVRMVVRHSHFFLNCISSCVMHPMEELKRDVYPAYQKRLYEFLRHLFYNWPLDNSFRIVYETWLSYVQPWRYAHYERIRTCATPKEAAEAPVDPRWYGFLQENILYYTKLFDIMLNRMRRVDFATTKNALLFYRVAKVFTAPEQLKHMLLEIDNLIISYEQPYGSQMNGLTARSPSTPSYSSTYSRLSSGGDAQRGGLIRVATLRQFMKDWENPDFVFEPLFSDIKKKKMYELIESAKSAKEQLQELIDATLTQQKRNQSWWDKLLGTNKQYNAVVGQSIAELNKAINQLEYGKNQFAAFFDIHIVEPPESLRAPVFTPTRLPRTTFIGSNLDGSVLEGTENKITVLPSGVFTCDMFVPIGNPDYSAVRSDECKIVFKWLTELSGVLNDKFANDIMRLYFQKSWKGKLARATFAQPVEYFDIEKRGRIRDKVRKVLPPRITLRFFSSQNFLLLVLALFMVCLLFGLTFSVFGVMLCLWVLYILIRAGTEPEKKLDDLIYLFGDRNYNVDFRGRKERIEQGQM